MKHTIANVEYENNTCRKQYALLMYYAFAKPMHLQYTTYDGAECEKRTHSDTQNINRYLRCGF